MNTNFKYSSCLNAIHNNDLDELIKLYNAGYIFGCTDLYSAIKRGYFDIVKHCIENNYTIFAWYV
jgi:hypothetical protein